MSDEKLSMSEPQAVSTGVRGTTGVPPVGAEAVLAESPEAVVSRLAQADALPWYKKKNLRTLYLILLPTCIGVEMTSGYAPFQLSLPR